MELPAFLVLVGLARLGVVFAELFPQHSIDGIRIEFKNPLRNRRAILGGRERE